MLCEICKLFPCIVYGNVEQQLVYVTNVCRVLEVKRSSVKREEKTRECHNIVTPVAPAYCFDIRCRSEVIVLYKYLSMDSINK